MSDGSARSERDPHRRFAEWLLATSDEDPPRDLAVHASVCADCQRQIAALDMLTGIELAGAGIPPLHTGPMERRMGATGRVAVAMGGVVAVAAIGVGSWRLVEVSGIGAPASESPTQAVLGNTGQPVATMEPSVSVAMSVAAAPSASPAPRATPQVVSTPGVTPVTLPPAATVRPTSAPTSAPTRTPRPTPAPSTPTPTATPTPTTPPTPTATPSPTPTESTGPVAQAA